MCWLNGPKSALSREPLPRERAEQRRIRRLAECLGGVAGMETMDRSTPRAGGAACLGIIDAFVVDGQPSLEGVLRPQFDAKFFLGQVGDGGEIWESCERGWRRARCSGTIGWVLTGIWSGSPLPSQRKGMSWRHHAHGQQAALRPCKIHSGRPAARWACRGASSSGAGAGLPGVPAMELKASVASGCAARAAISAV